MGLLETTFGHESIITAIREAYLQGRLPSQLLLVGPEGIGKQRVAWGMAELLLCSNSNAQSNAQSNSLATKTLATKTQTTYPACSHCASCQKVHTHLHEQILFIEPEKNLIKLERAQDIQDFLSLAFDRGPRIIIVNDVHSLNAQASNSLLKIFEEPPPQTYFFFITHRWMQVLPTIRSRAMKLSFSPLAENILERWCQSPKEKELIPLARGSVKELLAQKQEDLSQLRHEAQNLFERFFSEKDFFYFGAWREEIKDKDKLLLFIRYWLQHLHRQITARSSAKNATALSPSASSATTSNSPPTTSSSSLPALSTEKLWQLWEQGLELETGVLGHRDSVLLIEDWLLPVITNKQNHDNLDSAFRQIKKHPLNDHTVSTTNTHRE